MNNGTGSELDIALVNALQLNPRADWAELAGPLRHTPKTLARRWEALSESGAAWVAVGPGQAFLRYGCAAFLVVSCRPHAKRGVADALVAEPAVVSMSATSGAADFLVDAFAPDLDSLERLLSERIETIEGIACVTTLIGLTTYREGSRWQVQALDLEQSTRLTRPAAAAPRRPGSAPDDLDRTLLEALSYDGRRPWADLAGQCGTTGPTARRRVEKLIASGRIALRCEGANTVFGPVVPTTFMLRVPSDEMNHAGEVLGSLAQCRVVEAITGPSNLLLTMWFRSTAEIAPFEAALVRELPSAAIADRYICLRTYKRGGHILDTEGRSTSVTPPTPIFAATGQL
ncbi:Lrp/AsnC family transcriptional regulator [Streptomyces iconiensis]|uniref:Lrp/AsnC family transcriptional regulator n=1 Tax=Streptomyces iconiensis TaxID=1384038 RepID=A0ABT7A023_9ACTN|nr:Lrp/AsnC family transcriptional regulator [Streptomyces iconiensis]MDJ1134201.1 Lrp/AsnC family transcriptional regulator [Streptomyces iconiensis]